MIGELQKVNLGRQRRKSSVDLGPQFIGAMATAQMVQDHGVVAKIFGAFHEIFKMKMLVTPSAVPQLLIEERTLDQQDGAFVEPRIVFEDCGASVPAVGEPDLSLLLLDRTTRLFEFHELLGGQAPKLGDQVPPTPQEVIAQARHHMIGGKRLHLEICAQFHPIGGLERQNLVLVADSFHACCSLDEVPYGFFRGSWAAHPGCRPLMESALRENKGQPEGMIEVTVRQKNVAGTAQGRGTTPDVE